MSTSTQMQRDTLLRAILDWSVRCPPWQRDALRRLLQTSSLADSDINELTLMCKSQHKLSDPNAVSPDPVPLAEEHIPISQAAGQAVAITSISDVKNVNALATGQTMTFGERGLTVVYGDNASGKTGYARILKRACRARNRGGPIKPNVYENPPSDLATATITYTVAGAGRQTQWADNRPATPELSLVSYFDSDCGVVHVREANDIAFTPFGLDLLENLAAACVRVQDKLNSQREQLERSIPASLVQPQARPDTTVGKTIATLNHRTELRDLEKLSTLTDQEMKRLKQLQQDLANDPLQAARQLDVRRGRMTSLLQTLNTVQSALCADRVDAIKTGAEDAQAKAHAARLAATNLFTDEPLPTVGRETWRALWEAARRYSRRDAYPDEDFPYTGDSARCVLCQQPLSDEAADRLRRFDTFVRNETEQAARRAAATLAQGVQRVENLNLRTSTMREQLADLGLEDTDLAKAVRVALIRLRVRRRGVLQACKSGAWASVPSVPRLPAVELTTLITALDKRARDLAASARAGQRVLFEHELRELEDRVWLGSVLGDVKADIERRRRIELLSHCIRDTITTSITAESKALAEEHVTNRLRNTFARELQRLRVDKVRVELSHAAGQYGVANYQIRLSRAPHAPLADILSEGEHGCVALAGFLTELATAPANSSLIFDDPVCSLDHKWRKNLARRLVEEAANRQVVVFTHDIVFLQDLLDGAQQNGIASHVQRVFWSTKGVGTVGDSLPWKTQSTLHRLDALEKAGRKARALHQNNEDEEYEEAATKIYSRLRATVERAIEEQLFARVVVRYRDYVDVKELDRVAVLQRSDCNLLRELHAKCCDITDAHDPSTGRNPTVPLPQEILSDIAQLRNWVDNLRDRRKCIT